MIERYRDPKINEIWKDQNKLRLWQETEIAVNKGKVKLGRIALAVLAKIESLLLAAPFDVEWWLVRERELKHDLMAFVEERRRHLPSELRRNFHGDGMTSYDTEDPAFVRMLKASLEVLKPLFVPFEDALGKLALRHRYTIMNGRTHGQEAELQSLGKRVITWLADFRVAVATLQSVEANLRFAKLSGAVGNYGGVDPELERAALEELGLEPFYGATQITPRILFKPLADALEGVTLVLAKIALDIRLGSRSGRPIYQEPFGSKQKGSSAMPHKKNPITTEQIMGLARMVVGLCSGIKWNVLTWEERAIEQSSVERVNWPDMFHLVVRALKGLTTVIQGLKVYPDNMLLEVVDSRGTYAAAVAKDMLAEMCYPFGMDPEDCYRAVQLATFNAFRLPDEWKAVRDRVVISLEQADEVLHTVEHMERPPVVSIREIIAMGDLKPTEELEVDEGDIARWNQVFTQVFSDRNNAERWFQIFEPSYLLRNEHVLYREVLGVE